MIKIHSIKGYCLSLCVITAMALPLTASASAQEKRSDSTIGTVGIGDSIFPMEGNGGIDIQHYDLAITWDDKTGNIEAKATLDVKATQKLSAFNLDFHGLKIKSLTVDGEKSTFLREKDELSITLPHLVEKEGMFQVEVVYSGKPSHILDSIAYGWETSKDGVMALSEPNSAKNWFPNNNHPSDKASYTFHITVPKNFDVVANGTPQKTEVKHKTKTFHFTSREPMATYLTVIHIGQYDRVDSVTKSGIRVHDYFYRGISDEFKAMFSKENEILDFYAKIFVPYPFETAGVIVMKGNSILAYETQTRSTFGVPITEMKLAHEIAHQWFGDYVSLSSWKENWLKEGFANYAAALWMSHKDETFMGKWVKGNYESMMGIQHYPKKGLENLLKVFEVKERMLSAKEVEALINVGTKGKTDASELKKALALVPKEGISNYQLDEVLALVSFKEFVLSIQPMRKFFSIIDGSKVIKDDRSFEEIVSLLALAPRSISEISTMYGGGSYDRGALAIHVLHKKVGDEIFYKILKTYFETYGNGHAGSDDFIDIANRVNGQNLDSLFRAWLENEMIPDMPEYGLYVKDYAK